jgi:two-component system NarL family sensor kinase
MFYIGAVYIIALALDGISGNDPVPWWLNLVVLLTIALTFWPVRSWLRRGANQVVYGQYDNPYALIAHLNQRLDAVQSPQAIAPTLAETIASTLKLPYVAIETHREGQVVIVEYGSKPPSANLLAVPLAYNDTQLGVLRAAPRQPQEPLSSSDHKLLHDLARQAAITLYAAQLTADVQASRERIVTVREEERRRIRRDLHDGLAPTLSALRLQLGTLRRQIRQQPAEAEALVDELRGDLRGATGDIRRLVYELRPPLLDELGLVGALRNLGDMLLGVAFTLDAPETLPPLSAATEVAVYRIASEALHNVAKHAHATRCSIRLVLENTALTLTISDDGVGVPADRSAGIGLVSMRERAAELGGHLGIINRAEGGTDVVAFIPLAQPTREDYS